MDLERAPLLPHRWRPILRRRHISSQMLRRRRLSALQYTRDSAARALRSHGAGSVDGVWGPFSVVAGPFGSLEDALSCVSEPRARGLILEMPMLRALAVVDGQDRWSAHIDRELVAIVGTGPLMESRGRAALWEFITSDRRPQPEHAWHLMRSSELLRLTVTEDDDAMEPTIVIGSIGTRHKQGHGIGTAALRELCRFADTRHLRISGKIEPLDVSDPAFHRLAGWYFRHGFRQGGRDPQSWVPLGEMVRIPHD